MDRPKASSSLRGAKGKITQHPPDLFALGSKSSSSSRDSDVKRVSSSSHPKLSSSSHSLTSSSKDRKRDTTSSSLPSAPVSKKPKVFPPIPPARPTVPAVLSSSSERFGVAPPIPQVQQAEHWESLIIECDECELTAQILNAYNENDTDSAVGYLLGGIKLLRTQRYKPDPIILTSLTYISKNKPILFRNEDVTQALYTLLKRDSASSFKSKGSPQVPAFAVNLLMKGYEDIQNWPQPFFKYYLEDALGDRIWVDHELCTPFVENIQTAFSTKIPTKQLLQPELSALGNRGDTGSPLTINDDDTSENGNGKRKSLLEKHNVAVYSRFSHCVEYVEEMVLNAVKDHMSKKQPPETVTKNCLKFLATACGLVEVRMLSVIKLEMWLHNAKLMRSAQDLLVYLCYNSVAETQRDVEVISHLIKIRFKTKALVNVFLNCLRDMIGSHEENLPVILKHTIYNELSNARNPNNMPMIAVIFQTSPEPACNVLAEIFLELLLNKDDYLRPLRALLREIVRVLRYDIDMYVFCHALIRERVETTNSLRDFEFRERMFLSVADLICLCMFLAVSPSVREAASLLARGDRKELHTLQKFQTQISKIQSDALWWLHETILRMYRPNAQDFIATLRKILFLDSIEVYCKQDMWPSENERNIMMRLCTEVPLSQGTLIRLLLIGLSKDHPLQQLETLDYCDPLIKRAAAQVTEGLPMLQFDKMDIIDLIFNLCSYHHPENISLPVGYTPPQLAISSVYWKGWILLLIIAAHNPTSFGNVAWEKYPTLRMFMEMCITNHFTYPPPTMAMYENYEELKTKELQIAAVEKQQILEFETHLAAASTKIAINEANSLLLPQLITMAPQGVARRPPNSVLEQLRLLNGSHRLGHLLCRSRRPDFLLDIIQRQGPSQHMPWLAELVQNSEGALSHLPVQCLCEFLLSSGLTLSDKYDRVFRSRHGQLVNHLHTLLTNPKHSATAACEVLEYFLRRLASPHYMSRIQAIKGIKLVLQSVDDDGMEIEGEPIGSNEGEIWLTRQLPNMPHFDSVRSQVIVALRQACQVENDPLYISSYIRFLELHSDVCSHSEIVDLVVDMAQLIVERSTIIAAILPQNDDENNPTTIQTLQSLVVIFSMFLHKSRGVRREGSAEFQDLILIQWPDGMESIIHILVVHAMIILLTFGQIYPDPDMLYEDMLNTWFPLTGEQPKAFVMDTSEQVLFIPDWLKLRMIRSNVPRLVDAALVGLEPPQLVLFIQSFGIPVESMSKLLHALDIAVSEDQTAVSEAVLDKTYMAQLVEVQRQRGAVGGEVFVQVLQLHNPPLLDSTPIKSMFKRENITSKLIPKNVMFQLLPQHVPPLMSAIFEKEHYQGNVKDDFRLLLKNLTSEIRAMNVDTRKTGKLLQSVVGYFYANRDKRTFVQALLDSASFSSRLLRVLLSNANEKLINDLFDTFKGIYNQIRDKSSTVTLILKDFIDQCNKKIETPQKDEFEHMKIGSVEETIRVLKGININSFEKHGRILLEKGLEFHNNAVLVETITKLLLEPNLKLKNDIELSGVLIDWFALIEPELIGSCPDLQMDLLFSKNDVSAGDSKQQRAFRAYLLTLLIHRAGWATLHQCLGHLLADSTSRYDPTVVLDFFWAFTRNPKLLQGRDKNPPKNYKAEDILDLSHFELKSLVNYMLEEALIVSKSSNKNVQASVSCTELRLPLLLQCIYDNPGAISCVARHLLHSIKLQEMKQAQLNERLKRIVDDSDDVIILDDELIESERQNKHDLAVSRNFQKVSEQFLLLMYMHVPRVIHYILGSDRERIFQNINLTEWSSSILDKISHTLFTALAATPSHTKDWQKRSQEYELMARKITAAHPILILRQLPMIAASLRGRTHLEFNVFRARNHFNLFVQVLGLIELLQPHVFMLEYQHGLENTLVTYFSLFHYHGRVKELQTLLNRFVVILQSYINYDAKRALKFLQKHAHLLSDLQVMHPNISSLRDLMTGILLPRGDVDLTDQDGGDVLVAVVPPAASEQLPSNWDQITSSLSKIQGEDVQSSLQEIDHLSSRKPSILDTILPQLCRLMMSPTALIRTLAHTLLARHLKHNPASDAINSIAFTAVLRCLDSSNSDIVITTLEKLPELIVCMQENSIPILEKVFTLGVGSDINTTVYINKTINFLNLQVGC